MLRLTSSWTGSFFTPQRELGGLSECTISDRKWNNTGEVIRTPDLRVMSPARSLCATPVEGCLFNVTSNDGKLLYTAAWAGGLCECTISDRKWKNTGGLFWSGALRIMSPALCLWATPGRIPQSWNYKNNQEDRRITITSDDEIGVKERNRINFIEG